MCHCQTYTETIDHFLLNCDIYIDARHDLFELVNPIIENSNLQIPNNNQVVSLLLYGHAKLCERDNIMAYSTPGLCNVQVISISQQLQLSTS